MAGFEGTADTAVRGRRGRPNVCLSRAPTGAPDPKELVAIFESNDRFTLETDADLVEKSEFDDSGHSGRQPTTETRSRVTGCI
jgi:hypothetical protein